MRKSVLMKFFAVVMAIVFIMMSPSIIYASQSNGNYGIMMCASYANGGYKDHKMTVSYVDDANITRYVTYNQSCAYTVGYEEEVNSYFTDAVFYAPTNSRVGTDTISLYALKGYATKSGQIAYVDYRVNGGRLIVRSILRSDWYGEVSFYAVNMS